MSAQIISLHGETVLCRIKTGSDTGKGHFLQLIYSVKTGRYTVTIDEMENGHLRNVVCTCVYNDRHAAVAKFERLVTRYIGRNWTMPKVFT